MSGPDSWWATLPIFEKILWIIAVPSSVLTIAQAILEMLGAGDAGHDVAGHDVGDLDTDVGGHDAGGMHLFSFKGVVIFFTAFSWVGIVAVNSGLGVAIASVLGLAAGVVFMVLFAWIFYLLTRMTEAGNTNLDNAILQSGETYLRIPGNRSGYGKVMVKIQGSLRELRAVTDGDEIPTGSPIRVVDVVDAETLLVTKE
ncbi:MAG: hypothetical protein KJ042_12690 [Deltaproteobacteria bacterium]|nr:hypothetical protein [Deltaproteobacteria bacterium]